MTACIFSCRINYRYLSLVYLSLHVANPCSEFVICQTCLSRKSSSFFYLLYKELMLVLANIYFLNLSYFISFQLNHEAVTMEHQWMELMDCLSECTHKISVQQKKMTKITSQYAFYRPALFHKDTSKLSWHTFMFTTTFISCCQNNCQTINSDAQGCCNSQN